ncbi:hypothetical protein CC85DRAFT_288773 [Cutaneotrichosporon oleaginosum]|uniref:Uncharacterized protein n=1 Tax=Cutaneotrichosporon oleaginosum TaxID=879819 RepID=A0A0J1AV83_9TREE|nr:uncharacterized protein CC85DRAFT_288773 [Cutaneotrichosporon oleaginosum]KLT39214.1 hypothetical protein CC85DRAFT_288773 [Cutaneotrichosporon oleaginosum]TXT05707.1 hypothetical protein COLE_07027 [Cutaneotrichosporon oleaginosum]
MPYISRLPWRIQRRSYCSLPAVLASHVLSHHLATHHPRTSDASVQRQQREQPAHPNHPITRRYSLHSHTDHADSHTALPLTECASGPRDWLEIKIRSRNKRL